MLFKKDIEKKIFVHDRQRPKVVDYSITHNLGLRAFFSLFWEFGKSQRKSTLYKEKNKKSENFLRNF